MLARHCGVTQWPHVNTVLRCIKTPSLKLYYRCSWEPHGYMSILVGEECNPGRVIIIIMIIAELILERVNSG